ncbi:MAG: carbohydrate ABC transporter permease [Chloroflexota bacterium]
MRQVVSLASPRGGRGLRTQRWLWTLFFLGPGLAYFAVFHWLPVLQSIVYSTQRWTLLTARAPNRPFVGLQNYELVLQDEVFWQVAQNTLVYTIFSVGGTVLLGLLVAMALTEVRARLRDAARTIIFLPVVVSLVGASIIWKWLLDYSHGLVNVLIGLFGLPHIPWLTATEWAMPAVIITSIWKNLGFAMVIFLAGLLQIPTTYYEAAAVDGAGPWQRFRNITLPMLRQTTLLVTVTQLIIAFQVFTQVYVMTQGGPGDATKVLVQYIYEQGFEFYAMGKATAMSLILMVAILIISLVQMRLFGRSDEE